MMFQCHTHGVSLELREENGRTVRRFRQNNGYNRPKCALYAMKEPKLTIPGDLYKNAVTGRDAYSMCLIEEV